MTQQVRSEGYNALAKGMVYSFKKEAGPVAKWTPHNIRYIYILGDGFFLQGYDSQIPVMTGSKIPCDLRNTENLRDVLAAMYSLGNALSANVSNCEGIIVLLGGKFGVDNSCGSSEDFRKLIGYDDMVSKIAGRTKMCVPEFITLSGVVIDNMIASNSGIIGPIAAIKSCIAQGCATLCANTVKAVLEKCTKKTLQFCRPVNSDALEWRVYDPYRDAALKNSLEIKDFAVDAEGKCFARLFSATTCLSACKHQLLVHYTVKRTDEDNKPLDILPILFGLDTNVSNYPADSTLREFISNNYYKPYAAYKYFMEDLQSTAGYHKLANELNRSIKLLGVAAASDAKHLVANKSWVKALDIYYVRLALTLYFKNNEKLATWGTGVISSLMRSANCVPLKGSESLGVKLDAVTESDIARVPEIKSAIHAYVLGIICLGCFSEYAQYEKLSKMNIKFRIDEAMKNERFKFKFPAKLSSEERGIIARMCVDAYEMPKDMLSDVTKYFPDEVLVDTVEDDDLVNILVKMIREGY